MKSKLTQFRKIISVTFTLGFVMQIWQSEALLAQPPVSEAVFVYLNSEPVPTIEEQETQEKIRKKLLNLFKLKKQVAFEQAIQQQFDKSYNKLCSLKCLLAVHAKFQGTHLFVFHQRKALKLTQLLMLDLEGTLRQKTTPCIMGLMGQKCSNSITDDIENLLQRMEPYFILPKVIIASQIVERVKISDNQSTITSTLKEVLVPAKAKENVVTKIPKKGRVSVIPEKAAVLKKESKIDPEQKRKLAVEQLQGKLSQRRYNAMIWSKIKKELMFFRQKYNHQKTQTLQARLRLHIDRFGRIVERKLIHPSDSDQFNETILNSVNNLRLPAPMAELVKYPPYVVNILIQP